MSEFNASMTGEIDGHEVTISVVAAEDTEAAEREAEKVFMDLQARAGQLKRAIEGGDKHPDEATPFVKIDWVSELGLEETA